MKDKRGYSGRTVQPAAVRYKPVRPVRYRTHTKYRREVAVVTVVFLLVRGYRRLQRMSNNSGLERERTE
ncbi:hypothetical protein EVAR_36662_1 [Eumeta japonica]|uniref:Uncharacterized protein n=1 Tax=Eumeta variegata TaxID=151549 RepID=A0A4C1XXY6_EUMVA|nr:hypothetical protein EVAR_36662_1 [Eumeta japonica]